MEINKQYLNLEISEEKEGGERERVVKNWSSIEYEFVPRNVLEKREK
jgi:hypothetical protein